MNNCKLVWRDKKESLLSRVAVVFAQFRLEKRKVLSRKQRSFFEFRPWSHKLSIKIPNPWHQRKIIQSMRARSEMNVHQETISDVFVGAIFQLRLRLLQNPTRTSDENQIADGPSDTLFLQTNNNHVETSYSCLLGAFGHFLPSLCSTTKGSKGPNQ